MIPKKDDYDVAACRPGELSELELALCIEILKAGGAVDVSLARLSRAQALAIARLGKQIVGVGAIKRINSRYAGRIALRSGFEFPNDMPELGYVAVDARHGNQELSKRVVATLLSIKPAALYATTYSEYMSRTLAAHGFVRKGREWPSEQKPTLSLSLWVESIQRAERK